MNRIPTATMDILSLNNWLHRHCPTCSTCQELLRKGEVCQEYGERHNAMLDLVKTLSEHDLEALADVTRRDWFRKYETGLARFVRFWRGDEMALCFACGNLVIALHGKCCSCGSDRVTLISGKLDDVTLFANKVQQSRKNKEDDRAFLRAVGIKPTPTKVD